MDPVEFRREIVLAGESPVALLAPSDSPAGALVGVPAPAVEAKAKRPPFTAEYKLRILREASVFLIRDTRCSVLGGSETRTTGRSGSEGKQRRESILRKG